MDTNTSVIQGKQVPFVPKRIPIADIDLDVKNPRLQYLVGQIGPDVTQSQLDEMIWEKDQVKALAQSIYQNGGVREPIIVQKVGEKYVVREGNCRLVSSKHLAEQNPGDDRFTSIPAQVFEQDLSEEDLAVLLADLHVAKKISWNAYEQAKYIHDLHTVYGKTYDWLSNHLRISKGKISEALGAYRATTDYLSQYPSPSNIKKFSFFQEAMKKKILREALEHDDQFRTDFYGWIDTGKVTDARQVRTIPEIMESESAYEAFNEKGYDAAQKVLITNDPSKGSALFAAVKSATEALQGAPASDIQDLKSGNPQKLIMLRNLKRSLEDLTTLAGISL